MNKLFQILNILILFIAVSCNGKVENITVDTPTIQCGMCQKTIEMGLKKLPETLLFNIVLFFFNGHLPGGFFYTGSLRDYWELRGLLRHIIDVFFHAASIFRCSESVWARYRLICMC